MTNKELANLMYPNVIETINDYEIKYPERNLPKGAVVSRYAPSPTGFVHMGNMLSCFIENKLPQQTNGVFYLRIEDTDQKREIENGIENIVNAIKSLGLKYDEGVLSETQQKGKYGPYIQSQRIKIYDVFAKHMIENDMAYPCFCEENDLGAIREIQQKRKDRIGYYGNYAKCRNLTNEERAKKIEAGVPYTIRLKSTGSFDRKVFITDLVKGKVSFPENDQDIILIKSNGIPVYHFAHAVDDHLMHTTHVLRGEDWLSSIPVHIELFSKFGFELPQYAHLGLVMLVDENGTKRKISKRKDLDYSISNFEKKGFPEIALQEYLMTIANTNFEAWRESNPEKSLDEFEFTFSKVGSNPLFDMSKLVNLSKNCISRMSANQLYNSLLIWAEKYDEDFYETLKSDEEYSVNILNIEREQKKPRKDFSCYEDIKKYMWYMFEKYFDSYEVNYEWQNINDIKFIDSFLNDYLNNFYDEKDDKDQWFGKIRLLAEKYGFATSLSDYKNNPDQYKGNITDIATIIRVAITKKSNSPDLYEIMKLLGKKTIEKRINKINDNIKN